MPSDARVFSPAPGPRSWVLPEGPTAEELSQEATSFARTGSGGRKQGWGVAGNRARERGLDSGAGLIIKRRDQPEEF